MLYCLHMAKFISQSAGCEPEHACWLDQKSEWHALLPAYDSICFSISSLQATANVVGLAIRHGMLCCLHVMTNVSCSADVALCAEGLF